MAGSNVDEPKVKNDIPPFLAKVGGQNRITIPDVIRTLLDELEQGDIILIGQISVHKRKDE